MGLLNSCYFETRHVTQGRYSRFMAAKDQVLDTLPPVAALLRNKMRKKTKMFQSHPKWSFYCKKQKLQNHFCPTL